MSFVCTVGVVACRISALWWQLCLVAVNIRLISNSQLYALELKCTVHMPVVTGGFVWMEGAAATHTLTEHSPFECRRIHTYSQNPHHFSANTQTQLTAHSPSKYTCSVRSSFQCKHMHSQNIHHLKANAHIHSHCTHHLSTHTRTHTVNLPSECTRTHTIKCNIHTHQQNTGTHECRNNTWCEQTTSTYRNVCTFSSA